MSNILEICLRQIWWHKHIFVGSCVSVNPDVGSNILIRNLGIYISDSYMVSYTECRNINIYCHRYFKTIIVNNNITLLCSVTWFSLLFCDQIRKQQVNQQYGTRTTKHTWRNIRGHKSSREESDKMDELYGTPQFFFWLVAQLSKYAKNCKKIMVATQPRTCT
jgi:hypothetical protein